MTAITKLAPDGSTLDQKRNFVEGGMSIVAGSYGGTLPAITGYSGVTGTQYAIATPGAAEVLQVARGEIKYVDKGGKEYLIRKGDVLFLAPHRPYTARDAVGYSHQYVVFPASGADVDKMPNAMILRPSALQDSDYTATPGGREHVYLRTAEGNRIVAWKAAPTGEVRNAAELHYVAFTGGSGTITQQGRSIAVAAGDTVVIPAGVSYNWSGKDLVAVYVSVGTKGTLE